MAESTKCISVGKKNVIKHNGTKVEKKIYAPQFFSLPDSFTNFSEIYQTARSASLQSFVGKSGNYQNCA